MFHENRSGERTDQIIGSGEIERKKGKRVLHTTEQLCEASGVGPQILSDTPLCHLA